MKVWHYGDDVNTDQLFPGKYTYTCNTPDEIKPHLLEDLDPEFAKNVRPGDVIVAGKNFGCGSSREQAAACLKAAGVQAVVAKSFARIYFRNAINLGLPVLQCPEASDVLQKGNDVEIDFAGGKIISGERVFTFPPLPDSVIGILEAGGLLEWTKKKLERRKETTIK